MNLAIIKTGGKQYLVSPGDKIKIEKIEGKEGDTIEFTDVLLLASGPESLKAGREKDKKIDIGKPTIKGIKVAGKILKQGRGDKIIVFKYKSKKRYKKKAGHRQPFTEVEITEIGADKKKAKTGTTKKRKTEKKTPKTESKK